MDTFRSRIAAFLFVSIALAPAAVLAQGPPALQSADSQKTDIEAIWHILAVNQELMTYLDDVYKQFGDGYLLPGEAQKKINLMTHEYNKLVSPVPQDAQKLYKLTVKLMSRMEHYFIFFKKIFREHPDIAAKIIQARYEVSWEMEKLRSIYGYPTY
ncbi:MAG: hypothetical protein P9L88_06075 [Candidatus Tantalella remota]|nr:hypothetical protein [Candidatus Tantalella remota]